MTNIISSLYLFWYKFVLFIKIIYRPKLHKWKKKGKRRKYSDFNEAIYNLIGFCYISILFFLFTIIEIFLNIKGLIFLAKIGIPGFFIAIISVVLFYLLKFLLFLLFPKLKIKKDKKIGLIRKAIKQTKGIRLIYPLIFAISMGLLFILTTVVFIYLAA
jgi:hypothetical protein